ncbi:expressed protein [Phakopsora pachyrhizi]|uniref:Expressed protein n=1 Tax=Phakopsora pachyrhizi TaxID=170000 RepID=A0A0S1MJ78_PHAPC|nr:expressed protein [Phakopsora pachyrhizi]
MNFCKFATLTFAAFLGISLFQLSAAVAVPFQKSALENYSDTMNGAANHHVDRRSSSSLLPQTQSKSSPSLQKRFIYTRPIVPLAPVRRCIQYSPITGLCVLYSF